MPVHEKKPSFHLLCLHLQCNTEFSCALTLLTEIIPKFSFPLLLQEMLKSHFQLNLTWSTTERVCVFLSDLIKNIQDCKSKDLTPFYQWLQLHNQQRLRKGCCLNNIPSIILHAAGHREKRCLVLFSTCSYRMNYYLASLCNHQPYPRLPKIQTLSLNWPRRCIVSAYQARLTDKVIPLPVLLDRWG